jgi:hypothetical protein
VEDVHPRQHVFRLVDVAGGQPIEERSIAAPLLFRLGNERIAGGGQPQRRVSPRKHDDKDAALDRGHAAGAKIRIETMSQGIADGPRVHASILPGRGR